MELSSLTYPVQIRNTGLHRKILQLLVIFTLLVLGLPPTSFSQHDYVPGMEKFPDIDVTHYDLHAEFLPDTIIVKAKAVVEFQVKEARTNLVIFEIDRYSDWTWSHELAHHWFGGVIRAKTPEDYCLLMEGPAEYFSRLFIRSIRGDERFKIDLKVQRMVALAGGEIAPLTEYYTLEKGGEFLYAKGSYIFHMLRHIAGDEKFFGLMRKLLQNFHMKPAGIRDLEEIAEEAYGQSLKWFFEQWVYGTGIPEYELSYHIDPKQSGKYKVSGLIKQKLVEFIMPVEIVAINKDKKYAHKALVEGRKNPFQFEVDFKPDTVLLDPEYNVLRWDDDIRVWLYTSRGRKLVHNKEYNEAKKLLDRALQINPDCSWAALERAAVAELQDQIELALHLYLQALDEDLNFHLIPWPQEQLIQVLYLSVGYCYDLLGKRIQAITWYQKVIQTGRDPGFAFYYDKAQEYLKKPASKKK